MLDGLRLPAASLARQVQRGWGVRPDGLLPVAGGEDSHAWAFEVQAPATRYFLKLRHGPFDPPAAMVPAFLREAGMSGVVAPLTTTAGRLWHTFAEDGTGGAREAGGYTSLLYPFVAGEAASRRGLTGGQWVDYGRFLTELHAVHLPADLAATLRAETFRPSHLSMLREVTDRIRRGASASPSQHEVARLWHTHAAGRRGPPRAVLEAPPRTLRGPLGLSGPHLGLREPHPESAVPRLES